jgi:hypothetical protein
MNRKTELAPTKYEKEVAFAASGCANLYSQSLHLDQKH